MNTPVSFPLAKLAIQKGFDKECKEYWNLIEYSSEWIVEHRINPDSVDFMYAPTISEVVMWLYEKHGIWIHPEICFDGKSFVPKITKVVENHYPYDTQFNSPTEAYSAAIEYCLTKLI